MMRYAVPPNQNQKVFRIFAYGSIGLMLIFLALSQSEWLTNDRISHAIGWSAMGLLIVFMGGVFVLIAKESALRAWQKHAFDLADQKIVRVSDVPLHLFIPVWRECAYFGVVFFVIAAFGT